MGIGHVRRNLLVARAIASGIGRGADVLLVSGVAEAGAFSMPEGVDCLTLPSLQKCGPGMYQPRRLGISSDRLMELRQQIIQTAIRSFQPHAMIVDKLPLGV